MSESLSRVATEANRQCRLCGTQSALFYTDKKRSYHQCPSCHLVFVPEEYFLSDAEEKAVYDLHQNVPGDLGYENFLSRAAAPVVERFSNCSDNEREIHGLDFGCGPSPVLAQLLARPPHHYTVDFYDLYYSPANAYCLEAAGHYDFVTATEVVEHLADPLMVLRTLWKCLSPDNGILVIMTKRVEGTIECFRNWHYIRDPTHITFFHTDTFAWLSKILPNETERCTVHFHGGDVVVLNKNGAKAQN